MPPKVEVIHLGLCELRNWGRQDHDFCRELTVVLRHVLILSCVRQFGEVYDTIHSVSSTGQPYKSNAYLKYYSAQGSQHV